MGNEAMESDAEDLPEALPLSSGESDIPSELPLSDNEADVGLPSAPAGHIPEQPVAHPVESIQEATQLPSQAGGMSNFQLVPQRAPKGKGRGRAGRPKAGFRLMPYMPARSEVALPSSSDALASPPDSAATSSKNLAPAAWATDEVTMDNAEVLAHIPFGVDGLGWPSVIQSFAGMERDSTSVVAACMASMQRGDQEISADVNAVAEHFLCSSSPYVTSWSAIAATLGMDQKRVVGLVHRIACTWTIMHHCRIRMFETKALRVLPRNDLLHYVEACQYDETPMQVRLVGEPVRRMRSSEIAGSSGTELACIHEPEEAVVLQVGDPRLLKLRESASKQKLVQTQGDTAMVLRIGAQITTICFKSHYPLAVVQSTTGACLKQLQLQLSRTGPAAKAFVGVTRAVTTDAASSNSASEGAFAEDRREACGIRPPHCICIAMFINRRQCIRRSSIS